MVMITNNPPSGINNSSTRSDVAIPASAAPSASEPVSPINIFAGDAFHQRKPVHEPANAAASTAGAGINTMLGTTQLASSQAAAAANSSPLIAGGAGANTTTNLINSSLSSGAGGVGASTAGQVGTGLLNSSQALAVNGAQNMSAVAGASQGSGGFFSKLMTDMTPKDWIIAGGTVVSGGAKAMSANQANANAQKKFEYEQGIKNQQIKNLNTVPSLISAPSMA